MPARLRQTLRLWSACTTARKNVQSGSGQGRQTAKASKSAGVALPILAVYSSTSLLVRDVWTPEAESLSRLGWYTSLAIMFSGFVTCGAGTHSQSASRRQKKARQDAVRQTTQALVSSRVYVAQKLSGAVTSHPTGDYAMLRACCVQTPRHVLGVSKKTKRHNGRRYFQRGRWCTQSTTLKAS